MYLNFTFHRRLGSINDIDIDSAGKKILVVDLRNDVRDFVDEDEEFSEITVLLVNLEKKTYKHVMNISLEDFYQQCEIVLSHCKGEGIDDMLLEEDREIAENYIKDQIFSKFPKYREKQIWFTIECIEEISTY